MTPEPNVRSEESTGNADRVQRLAAVVVGSASISISDSISDRAIALPVMLRGEH